MIDMGMGVHHRHHITFPEMLINETFRRRRSFLGSERINHQPTSGCSDKGNNGGVVAAHLIETFGHFEKSVNSVQLCLTPERRINRVGSVALDEIPLGVVPTDWINGPWSLIGDRSLMLGDQTF